MESPSERGRRLRIRSVLDLEYVRTGLTLANLSYRFGTIEPSGQPRITKESASPPEVDDRPRSNRALRNIGQELKLMSIRSHNCSILGRAL